MANLDPLIGPRLKVDRAKRHLADFEAAFETFVEGKPYEVIHENDSETGEDVYRLRVYKALPGEFSIIIGDAVHNLRSALDQLVCGLVRANRRQVTGGNSFPIAGSAKKFEESCVGKLKNVSLKADRFIRRLKPYKGGNAALWLISELDNMDKHNAIVPVATGDVEVRVQWMIPFLFKTAEGQLGIGSPPEGAQMFGSDHPFGRPDNATTIKVLYDNVELYRSRAAQMGLAENVQASAHISFGKTQVTNFEPVLETVEALIKLVERIINIVERRIL